MVERSLKFLIIPAKAMRLTQFEIVYLAGIVLWTVSGKAIYAYKKVHEFLGTWTGQCQRLKRRRLQCLEV
jgi:hypothetical protein